MDNETFRTMRILEVKQRVQIVVVYEELDRADITDTAVRKEWVTSSTDRNLPIPYDQ